MQRLVALAVVVSMLAVGVGKSAQAADPGAKQPSGKGSAARDKEAGLGDFVIGEPIRYKNLTIFPVSSKVPRNEDRYLTLDEGLKAGTVQVFEVGAQRAAAPNAARQTQTVQRPARRTTSATSQTAAGSPENTTRGQAKRPPRTNADDDPFGEPPAEQPPQTANRAPAVRQQVPQAAARQVAGDDPFGGDEQPGADVNGLMIVNLSDKPLYIMPGEIIYGGQQDRTIGEEAIIPPSKTPVKVSVYCVESGRWAMREVTETAVALERLADSSGRPLDAKARQKLAEEAKQGKFVAHAGSLNKGGRAAVQAGKGQSEVWSKVGQTNASSGAVTASDAFTANYTDPKVLKQLQTYIDACQPSVATHKQVVGAIVAVNGKVEAVDVFQSTPLFQRLWPKLLKSHALDALAVAGEKGAEKPSTPRDATEFLRSAMQAGVAKTTNSQGGLVVTKRDSEKVMSFSAGTGAMGGMGGGFGGSVHSSGYSK
jgi:hypothetical protein